MAVYAIGDIQGCYREFRKLLKKIDFQPRRDRLMLVGDLVNRGPDSIGVMRYVLDHQEQIEIVLGNHELHMLVAYEELGEPRLADTFTDVLNAPDCNDIMQWLRLQPLATYNSEMNILMVHAGVYPSWSLEDCLLRAAEASEKLTGKNYRKFLAKMYGNKPNSWSNELSGKKRWRFIVNSFTRMRYLYEDGKLDFSCVLQPGKQPVGLFPWFNFPGRISLATRVVFGHWSSLGLYQDNHVIALDTGCCWGRKLTAIRVDKPELEIIQTKCK